MPRAFYDIGCEPPLDPPEYSVPECPICYAECNYYYIGLNRNVVGCENCANDTGQYDKVGAYEWSGERNG